MTGTSFLDLTESIRYHIYAYAGLYRPCPVTLCPKPTSGLVRSEVNTEHCVYKRKCLVDRYDLGLDQEFDCYCPFFPMALLRVCRDIHEEATRFFYAMNKLQLLGNNQTDLEFLLTLPELAMRSMSSLLVRLNCWPCPRGHDEVNLERRVCLLCYTPVPNPRPLCISSSAADGRYLSIWTAVCTYLASRIRPHQLRFTFIGDAQDICTAQNICSSIKLLPYFRSCNIRLGWLPDPAFSEIARQTAQQQTGKLILDQAFRFAQLPPELRLHVLSYTHLTPDKGIYGLYENIVIIRSGLRGRCHLFGVPQNCCWKCNDTRSNCCCPARRSAVSSDCVCRLIPSELFLVNKQMKAESEYIFFTSNCFDFEVEVEDIIWFIESHWSKENLRSIRQIRIVFNDDQLRDWRKIDSAWRRLVDLINQNLNVRNLCLIISKDKSDDLDEDADPRMQNTGVLRYVYDAYCQIVLRLHRLHGLQDLHLEFAWFRKLEALLEKNIMGIGYDSRVGNKRAKRMSVARVRLPDWHASAWEENLKKFNYGSGD